VIVMVDNGRPVLSGVVVDEASVITIDEVTRYCAVQRETIVELVVEGIIEPEGQRPEEWRFGGRELSRAKRAIRLANDLDINLDAVAIILDLLDQIDDLRGALERRGR
jgi:chaperone modulatory protein CbpM